MFINPQLNQNEEYFRVRSKITALCHEISGLLILINERMSADSAFVFDPQYLEMKRDLREKSEELSTLKSTRAMFLSSLIRR